MDTDQLRLALKELNGKRDAVFHFMHGEECAVSSAMLIPTEADQLVKVTDGRHVYIIDAARLDWIKIG